MKTVAGFILLSLFFFVEYSIQAANPMFNSLHSTWRHDRTNKKTVIKEGLPRTTKEAKNFRFSKVDDQCEGSSNGKFRGIRYRRNNDIALTLLFDTNGIIAGMQSSGTSAPDFPEKGWQDKHYFIKEGTAGHEYWTQTVYFVHPDTICAGGRTEDRLKNEGTRTGFWIQRGQDPSEASDLMQVPLDKHIAESDQHNWNYGTCFKTMGIHHSYAVSEKMDCGDFVPITVLFNKDAAGREILTGFVFIQNAVFSTLTPNSPQFYDFPRTDVTNYGNTLKPVPECFKSKQSWNAISTIHVYFNSNPLTTSNC